MLFSLSSSDLLPRVPLSARSVLVVGRGDSGLVAAIRRTNPKAHIIGIETDIQAAEAARPYLDVLHTGDPESDPPPLETAAGLDCIIYDNVLHHMRDPWAVVARHLQALAPDGTVLICVPNMDYWQITDRRLRGAVTEADLRTPWAPWMTLPGIMERIQQAGLSACDASMREPDREAAAWFCKALAPGLISLGLDAKGFANRSSGSHLIVRAKRDAVRPILVSGNMLPPIAAVSDVRVVLPLQAIGTIPGAIAQVTDKVDAASPTDGLARIFVIHRPVMIGQAGLDMANKLFHAGYLSVTEFDDHPDHFPMMRSGGELGFVGVHAIQTSTPALAEVLSQYNPEIAVFPNAIAALPEVGNFATPGVMTFFFGALNREAEWRLLMPIINEIAAYAGDRLRFQVLHDESFFNALETPHKTFTPICDYQTYMRILGESEISFMPLSDTPFNRSKSDLKFIEAGACRVVPLASDVVYGHSIEDGRTGLLFRDPAEFRSRLLRLLALPAIARDIADAARTYVADKRMMAYQVAPRLHWYRSLWERREELEAERQDRMRRFLADRPVDQLPR